ncbi:MAG: carotenoid oxygenase family protein [Acidimicrobiales bacterium]
MATLTTNLFHGMGEVDLRLDVVEGHWPADMDGAVFVVGPDKRSPGGHWFSEHGLVLRIDCRPGADGTVAVRSRRIDTPVARLRRRFPNLFRQWEFMEVSPFGVTNLANTNLQPIDGRLFVGYDAGRPIEVDPETLEYLTAVGGNDEWYQSAPGVLEPLVSVAAHPAPAFDERALYFVNYSPLPGGGRHLARWGLNGPVERWPLEGMGEFDSIHDIKATRDHLVICDLPFVMDATFGGGERTRANQVVTRLWIVKKADLRATPPGEPVPVTALEVPFPTGHLSVDHDNPAGRVVVNLEHIPVADRPSRWAPTWSITAMVGRSTPSTKA